jgi:hypothetical protein
LSFKELLVKILFWSFLYIYFNFLLIYIYDRANLIIESLLFNYNFTL